MEGNHTFIPHYAMGRGNPSLSHLFELTGHNEEGRPSPLRLFDFIRRDEEGKPSLSCLFDVRCDKAPNTKSVPVWVYSWCSNFVPSPSNRTCKTCPDGHVLHVWCCLQHRAPETRPFGCFLVLGSFPIPCCPTTPPSLNTRDRGVLFN